MQRRSSSFAAVRFLDRDAVVAALRRLAESLRRADADVQSIVLFGSIARGDCGRRSDADLLVLLKSDRNDRRMDRIPSTCRRFSTRPCRSTCSR